MRYTISLAGDRKLSREESARLVGQVARMFSEEGHEPSFKKKGGRLSIELDVDSEEEAKALFELVMQKLFGEQ